MISRPSSSEGLRSRGKSWRTARSKCLSCPLTSENASLSISSTPACLLITRKTSRHMTLPDPSQILLTGISRYSRGSSLSSQYPTPPSTSIASATNGMPPLQTANFAAGVNRRAQSRSLASLRRSQAWARRNNNAVCPSNWSAIRLST